MEIYFNAAKYDRLYNCNYLNQSQWSEYAIPEPTVGVVLIVLGAVYLVTYIPCLIVMRKKEFFENPCFKLMFLHGCIDICTSICTSFITGYLMIVGTTFCTHPTVQFFVGVLAVIGWCGQCLICNIIAINRCLEFWSPNVSAMLFEGRKTYAFYVLVALYMLTIAIFTKGVNLTSSVFMWLYDPYVTVPVDVITIDRSVYSNMAHTYNNYILIPSIFVLYAALITSIWMKGRGGQNQMKIQLKLLRQAGLICLLNSIPGYTFLAAIFLPTPPWVVVVCMFTWQLGNGGGGLILLLVNETMRRRVLKMVFNAKVQNSFVVSTRQVSTVPEMNRNATR